MNIDWLDAFLITGLFQVAMVTGLALLLHLQLGLARIANFGVVGFWGIGMYAFGVLYVKVDWPFGDPWQFLVCAAVATLVAGVAGLLIGWLISDLNTDGVLVGTLGFATAVQILATTEDDFTGGARGMGGLAFPFDIGRVKDNEFLWLVIMAVVVAAILFYVWRVHRSPYGRLLIAVGRQRAARAQPREVDVPGQALAVRRRLGGDGIAGCNERRHGPLPRRRQHRGGRHPRGDGRAGPGWHGSRLGRGRGRDPHGGPVRHRGRVDPPFLRRSGTARPSRGRRTGQRPRSA